MQQETIEKDMSTVIMLTKACLSITVVSLITIIYPNIYLFLASWVVIPPLVFLSFRRK
jgi:hypothetical protein